MARRDGVSKVSLQQAAADSRGFGSGLAHAGAEGRITVLPWYRLVGVAKYLQSDARRGGKIGLPGNRQGVATWYGDDSPHLSLSRTAAVFTAAVGVRQGKQSRLVKTDKIQSQGSVPPLDTTYSQTRKREKRRRLDVQSGLRKGQEKRVAWPCPSVPARDRGH